MMLRPCLLALSVVLCVSARAQSLLPPESVTLDSLAAFKSPGANWQLGGGLGGDPRREKTLRALPGAGVLVNNPTAAAKADLFTAWEHSDLELDLDFLMPLGSNSGVYLMGRYEVQLFDSWGVKAPAFSDCGGIYQRWDEARGDGQKGYEGTAPRANASRAPGLWQHLHVQFQAPRFDAAGKKIRNARFTRVVLNGFVVQENVEVTGPTRASPFTDEKPLGPLMIQGDHGSVALREIRYKRFDPDTRVAVENLTYRLFAGESRQLGEFDSRPATREGVPTSFAADAVEKTGRYTLTFHSRLIVPRDGAYAFTADGAEPVRVAVDGQVVVDALEQGGLPGSIHLTKGNHVMRVDFLHMSSRAPVFQVALEGPGIAPQVLTSSRMRARDSNLPQLLIAPTERVRLQRGFVPFDPKKRLYAINVGSPSGTHFAYDFETGSILRVWRGNFLDMFEMWDGRGENQISKPAGPALTLNAKPSVALLERSAHDWPDAPEALWSSDGYTLEPDGQPVFLARLSSLTIRDRIAVDADGRSLTRTLTLGGRNTDWQTWVLLAEGRSITPQTSGQGFIVGDREFYLDLPLDSAVKPFVRTRNGRQQLVLPVAANALTKPIVYTLVW
ncbi:MAG TPA: family 16 glycoside hydrolase [Opitutaceae bacterium]|nr:family 16 glycoside hydrolase [Opitutaceae bacterium]